MSKLNKPGKPEVLSMNALVIYVDLSSFARANNALRHSAQNTDFSAHWNIKPWRTDMLKFPPTAEDALTEAMDAHLLVFAGRSAPSLPFWLQDWLERWAKYRRVEDAGLAVIGAGNPGSVPSQSYLSEFAERHGLSVIFDDRGVIEDSMVPTECIPLTLDKEAKDSYRGWGINE